MAIFEPTVLLAHPEHESICVCLTHMYQAYTEAEIQNRATLLFDFLHKEKHINNTHILLYACIQHATATTRVMGLCNSDDESQKLWLLTKTDLQINDFVKSFIRYNEAKVIQLIQRIGSVYTVISGTMPLPGWDSYFLTERNINP